MRRRPPLSKIAFGIVYKKENPSIQADAPSGRRSLRHLTVILEDDNLMYRNDTTLTQKQVALESGSDMSD